MSRKPPTFAEEFYLEGATLAEKMRRDLRLIRWLFGNVTMWIKTRKARSEFRRCREKGETFYVDRFNPPWQKK